MFKLPKWLPLKESKFIFDSFNASGFEARLVGGCVRDIILNRQSHDIDIATTAKPEDVIKILQKKGLKVIPTGLKYGTVTAVLDNHQFEITSLRNDLNTDGRHAEVSFTDSWEEDALRRDFTINAMSMDLDGKIYDYFDGLKDIENKLIRFVGEPFKRIEEDHLRILRYFRFISYFGKEHIHRPSLEACKANGILLDKISGERIRTEMFRILTSAHIHDALELMLDSRILQTLKLNSIPENYLDYKFTDNALINLAALLRSDANYKGEAVRLAIKWRLSNNEKYSLVQLVEFDDILWKLPHHIIRKKIYQYGKEAFFSFLELLHIEQPNPKYTILKEYATQWPVPIFKIKGENIMDLGYNGREVGKTMQKLHNMWIDSDFQLNEKILLSRARDGI